MNYLIPLLVLLVAMPVRGALRGSASYSIVAESVDPAGESQTSASYGSVSDLGGVVDSGLVASPSEVVKHGFMGQVNDVAALAITGNASVNEGSTLQLAAWQQLDDGTYSSLSANAVSWSVSSGPLVSVSGTGLVTAGLVYQNTAAVVGGSWSAFNATFPCTVVDSLPDNYGSYAGDGLPDNWQVQYFGIGNPAAAPTMDPDGDGYDNAFEYAAGLNPMSAASRFSISLNPVTGQTNQRQIIFSPRYAGTTYVVESSSNLITWTTLSGTTVDAGDQRTVTDTSAGSRKFYRVNVTKP